MAGRNDPMVFVSYARHDVGYANGLTARLREAGVDAWYDRDLVAGNPWTDELEQQIRRSRAVVVVLTAHSVHSEYVRREILFAQQQGKVVIPLLVDDVELPLLLVNTQFVDGRHQRDPLPELLRRLGQPDTPPTRPEPEPEPDPGRRRGRRALALAAALWAALVGWSEFGPVWPANRTAVTRLLQGHVWVSYDPGPMGPYEEPEEFLGRLTRDVRMIRGAGFTGIVTYGGDGSLTHIPRLAKREGLAVIMGVWDASDPHEVSRAILLRRKVDAYCIGHNGLDRLYSMDALEDAVRLVRRRTGLPVTTTEEARIYSENRDDRERLCRLGDWLFPDVHLSLRQGPLLPTDVDSDRDAALYLESSRPLAKIAQRLDLPLMFKIVTCPHEGIPGASPEAQRRFFAVLLESLRDPSNGLPVRVSVTAHSAFDDVWKTMYPFYAWDPYTGLIGRDGAPHPAVAEIIDRVR